MFEIHEINEMNRSEISNLIEKNWGSTKMITKGKVHFVDKLPGLIATVNNEIKGLITFEINKGECEILSLDSFVENQGIGSSLLEKVVCIAAGQDCKRVWLITTNDNTHAMRFYQKRGFNMVALHYNAVNKAREIKPEIPLKGFDDILICHEIEFEKVLL
ncbi:MAG: GNAT family N-acetyltransferase [Clostridia bacterium]|nr:GNAT family N-acetyltransferase [Clostridia bacterium]